VNNTTYIAIELEFTVKNVGDKQITLIKIEVPDANYTRELNITLNPGEIYSGSLRVLEDIPFIPAWERGTQYTVKFS